MSNVINLSKVSDIESWLKHEDNVYIGRGSKWGNPYKVTNPNRRKWALYKYEKYIKGNRSLLQCLPELRGKTLGCWCHPQACHGTILQRLEAVQRKEVQLHQLHQSKNSSISDMISTSQNVTGELSSPTRSTASTTTSPTTAVNVERNRASPVVIDMGGEDATSRRTREYLEFFNRDLNTSEVVINGDHLANNNQQQDPFLQINHLQQQIVHIENSLGSLLGAFQGLNTQIKTIQDQSGEKDRKIHALEKELSEHQQYTRRENIEILGIPNTVGDDELEGKVINILNSIGCNISSYEIVACHRLRKTNANQSFNTIVRFTNRKIAHYALQNRKALKWQYPSLPNLFIVENLCPRYKSIFDKCLELKREGKLKYVWSWNGTVHYKMVDDRNVQGTKVFHISDLEHQFGLHDQPQQQRGHRDSNG